MQLEDELNHLILSTQSELNLADKKPRHRIQVGNWLAVWDEELSAWYYYDINSGRVDSNHILMRYIDSDDG